MHVEKDTECPGCDRQFANESAVLLHLEAGTCESGADYDYITGIAFACHQAHMYTCDDDGSDDDDSGFKFMCPTCETRFDSMSAVLQHVESDCCDETLAYWRPLAKFLRYLRSRF